MFNYIAIGIIILGYIIEFCIISYFVKELGKDVANDIFDRDEKIMDYLWFVMLYLMLCFSISFSVLLGYLSLKSYCILCALTFVFLNIVYLSNIDWKNIFKK